MATLESICDAFTRQAQYWDEHCSPRTTRLWRVVTKVAANNEPVLQPLAPWLGEPLADTLPLRAVSALHEIVFDDCMPAPVHCYPHGDRDGDDVALRCATPLNDIPRTAPRHGRGGTSLTIHRFGEPR